ncbi:Peptidyl-prolyl cis-trans isomerase B [Luteitalea pratensis]|uniref:peptidylprolyl isomerase n=1 Tax=Luteitalea pratensis TaxID=1855912 RepID=A0A143PWJ1_LUTPR|nr:peptidylprolyl isomerase [Luteitalea pratensis]AMY12942.1 Peptidyl-prolyl cis-trans isomerase B [Luteitalea pratensis]
MVLAHVWLGTTALAQAQAPAIDVRTAILQADDARITSAAPRAVIDTVLASGTAEAQVMAVRAIGRTRRAEFLGPAVRALDNQSIDVRREAAFAVAHIGSADGSTHAAALDALRQRLTRETDPFVTASLAESIGRLSFPSVASVDAAAGVLAGAWARANASPARAVVSVGVARGTEAMARRVRTLAGTGSDSPGLVALLESLLDRHAPPTPGTVALQDVLDRRVRRLATTGLMTLRSLSAPRRVAAAGDADAQVRRLAVIDLSSRPEVSDADAADAFSDESMLVRHAAVSRLGSRLPTRAEVAVSDRHVSVRLAALDALGEAHACRSACETRLVTTPTGANWHEYAHALVAAARTDAAAARPLVARAASSDVWQVRMYAGRAAGTTLQADVLGALSADTDVNVRHAALAAWREAKLPNLTAAALDALGSDDGQLVIEAANALRGTGADRGTVTALRAALARLTAQKRETSRDPRVALIERIDELDAERATTLRPYLSDFDPFIAERVTALLRTRGVGLPDDSPGSPLARRSLGAGGSPANAGPRSENGPYRSTSAGAADSPIPPTWNDVTRLQGTTVTLTFSGNRTLTFRLYAELAPTAVARFVAQVNRGEWNGRTFHRVEPGFVVQGGSPAANEYAGAADFARDEFSSLSHVRGTIGISTRGPDTGDGQIFINLVDNARLDFAYTVLGSLTGDSGLIDDIVEGEAIESATVVRPVAADRRTSPAATCLAPGVGVGPCPTHGAP